MPVLPDYASPTALKHFLDDRGMAMQKKFGQNFMVNRAHRHRLVDALKIEGGAKVWEIGPGLGAMTADILDRGAELTAFEIDRGFAEVVITSYSIHYTKLYDPQFLKLFFKLRSFLFKCLFMLCVIIHM